MTYSAKVIAGGKIVIPAELRRELGLQTGDTLVIEREDGKLVLKSYLQVVREVQAAVREMIGPYQGSMVDELIAERRKDAAREDAEMRKWGETSARR
ncbi:hypothetical protein BH10PSE12_BH10PSE12_16750 [soil metagenome]